MSAVKRITIGLTLAVLGLVFMAASQAIAEVASSYGGADGLDGNPTACSGQPYDSTKLVAAHPSYPCGTRLLVKHMNMDGETRGVVVTVDDRGPFDDGRDLDLSQAASQKIGLSDEGVGEVEVKEVGKGTSSSSSTPAPTLPSTGGIGGWSPC